MKLPPHDYTKHYSKEIQKEKQVGTKRTILSGYMLGAPKLGLYNTWKTWSISDPSSR